MNESEQFSNDPYVGTTTPPAPPPECPPSGPAQEVSAEERARRAALTIATSLHDDASAYGAFQLLAMIGEGLHKRGGFECHYDFGRLFEESRR
jgi:hypothetical protein